MLVYLHDHVCPKLTLERLARNGDAALAS